MENDEAAEQATKRPLEDEPEDVEGGKRRKTEGSDDPESGQAEVADEQEAREEDNGEESEDEDFVDDGTPLSEEDDEEDDEGSDSDSRDNIFSDLIERNGGKGIGEQAPPPGLPPTSLLGAIKFFHHYGMEAVQNTLQKTLEKGRTIDKPDYGKDYSPLHFAVRLEDEPSALMLTSFLVSKGAKVDVSDREGVSPLAHAASLNRLDFLHLLMTMGASVNYSDCEKSKLGDTPLHFASRCGCIQAVKRLVESGANISQRNGRGQLPFDVVGNTWGSLALKNLVIPKEDIAEVRQYLLARDQSRRIALYYHTDFLLHRNIPEHQEGVDRVTSVMNMLQKQFSPANEKMRHDMQFTQQFDLYTDFELGRNEDIRLVHTEDYVNFVEDLTEKINDDEKERLELDDATHSPLVYKFTPELLAWRKSNRVKFSSDTGFSSGTLQAARRAVGACVAAVDDVCSGKNSGAFAVVRPPGHHAGPAGLVEEDSSCGFCIFNNVAVAAAYALKKYPSLIKRVAILDFDVHHGNGTEAIMDDVFQPQDKQNIFFVSFHLYSEKHHFYPQSGKSQNLSNNVLNIPLAPVVESSGSEKSDDTDDNMPVGREGFISETESRMLPALRAFHPDLIFISAGFDAAENDFGNGGLMDFATDDYAWFTEQVKDIADLTCHGRVISVLEGGYGGDGQSPSELYDRSVLARNTCSHVMALAGLQPFFNPFKPATPSPSPSRDDENEDLDNGGANGEEIDREHDDGAHADDDGQGDGQGDGQDDGQGAGNGDGHDEGVAGIEHMITVDNIKTETHTELDPDSTVPKQDE